jgi:fucose permease
MTFPLAVLSGLAFISLGLPDGLLGVAWPSIRTFFGLELDAIGALLVATTAGYVTSSFSSGRLLGHLNVGAVLALSCALTAGALLGYAAAPAWPLVIASGVVLGLGSGAVDSSLNTYAATQHGPRTLNWLHACYGVGAASGPLVMTAVLSMALPWQRGYNIVGLSQLLLAAGFAATFHWWQRADVSAAAREHERSTTIPATLRLAGARLGIAAFVVYAGVEGSMGIWTYTLLTEARGVAPAEAGGVVSLFWGSLTGGRLLAAAGGARLRPRQMLTLSLSGVVCGTALVWLNLATIVTYTGIVLAGCACGPIFPMLVATTPARVGPSHAANAVGFQIAAAALGLALLPGAIGVAADAFGIELIAVLFLVLASLLMIVYELLDHVAPA